MPLLTQNGCPRKVFHYWPNRQGYTGTICKKIAKVHHRPGKTSKRTLVTYTGRHTDYTVDHLFIRDEEQRYTPEYRALCRDFYLAF